MKKLTSLLLVLILALSLSVQAFAAPADTTITAPENSRTYEVYQIFTGDLANGVLSNVKWGQNGTTKTGAVDRAVLEALTALIGSEAEKAAEIAKYVDFSSESVGTVSNGSSITVPTGYYLIKDNGEVGDGETYSLYVVQVVGPTTINPKDGTTTSEKKVDDKNDSNTSEDTTVWQDSADYDIGDDVPFQLKATIASDYANYTKGYKLTFHDTESAGLSFNNDVKVYVDGNPITTGYTVTAPAADGHSFDVSFANLKDIAAVHAGSVITVEYTSRLETGAVIGGDGNTNTMHITYTNNPNDAQAGENGTTPDDKVVVFTYELTANKVAKDASGELKPLTGAGFTLFKQTGVTADNQPVWTQVGDEVKGEAMTAFSWVGIDDGTYKLVESTTPAGYNTMEDLVFTVSAAHVTEDANPTLTSLTTTLTGFNTASGAGLISGEIENQAGTELPSTGGMGTAIFYALGSLLVVGAAVVLVTRKRMGAED